MPLYTDMFEVCGKERGQKLIAKTIEKLNYQKVYDIVTPHNMKYKQELDAIIINEDQNEDIQTTEHP